MRNRQDVYGEKTREKIVNFIRQFQQDYGYNPSYRDICGGVGLKSTSSIHYHINRLVEDGKIERKSGLFRAIRVL